MSPVDKLDVDPRPTPSLPSAFGQPPDCYILNIDPGVSSGAALFHRGELKWAERVDVRDQRNVDPVVRNALCTALREKLTLVMVGERWAGGIRGNHQIESLGAAWKAWEWSLARVWSQEKAQRGIRGPAPKVTRVHLVTWRSKVFGRRVSGPEAKTQAVLMARSWYGAKLADDEHDIAEAILIGRFTAHWPEIAELIPKGKP